MFDYDIAMAHVQYRRECMEKAIKQHQIRSAALSESENSRQPLLVSVGDFLIIVGLKLKRRYERPELVTSNSSL
jgi:hypothetical protein